MKDQREYAKFEMERRNTVYAMKNPIYKPATTEFLVPESYKDN